MKVRVIAAGLAVSLLATTASFAQTPPDNGNQDRGRSEDGRGGRPDRGDRGDRPDRGDRQDRRDDQGPQRGPREQSAPAEQRAQPEQRAPQAGPRPEARPEARAERHDDRRDDRGDGRRDDRRDEHRFNEGRRDRDHDWGKDRNPGWRGPNWHGPERYQARPYIPPRGYYARYWDYGERLPSYYYGRSYWIDPYAYRLRPPPYGYHWVRVGNDVFLVHDNGGLIVEIIRDLFY